MRCFQQQEWIWLRWQLMSFLQLNLPRPTFKGSLRWSCKHVQPKQRISGSALREATSCFVCPLRPSLCQSYDSDSLWFTPCCAWCTEFGTQTWHSLSPLWKLQDLFKKKKIAQSEAGSFRTLKPLYLTQRLQRMGPVQAVIGQYEVLLSLEEMAASGSSDICTTARVLLEHS